LSAALTLNERQQTYSHLYQLVTGIEFTAETVEDGDRRDVIAGLSVLQEDLGALRRKLEG
jgi:hypothetical protein